LTRERENGLQNLQQERDFSAFNTITEFYCCDVSDLDPLDKYDVEVRCRAALGMSKQVSCVLVHEESHSDSANHI